MKIGQSSVDAGRRDVGGGLGVDQPDGSLAARAEDPVFEADRPKLNLDRVGAGGAREGDEGSVQ